MSWQGWQLQTEQTGGDEFIHEFKYYSLVSHRYYWSSTGIHNCENEKSLASHAASNLFCTVKQYVWSGGNKCFCPVDYDTWFCGKKQYQRTECPNYQDMVSISSPFCYAILCRLQERKMNTQEYALIESTIALNVPIIDYVSFSLFLHVMMIYVFKSW